jgi:hypothetical protein
VSDFGDMKIKKFDLDARLMEVLGKGEGRGPGEASNIMDMNVDELGRIWMTDSQNNRITIFESSENWEIIEPETIPARVLPFTDNRYMLKPRFSSSVPEIRNEDGTLNSPFQSLVKEHQLWTNVLDAFYKKDLDEGIILLNYSTNDFVRYNFEGEIEFFRRPIEPPELPEILPPRRYSDDQNYFFNEFDQNTIKQRTIDIEVVGDQIHLLVVNIIPENRRLADVYSVETGDYLYSYKFPENLSAFAITEKHFAGLVRDSVGIAIWSVNDEW